MTVVVPELLLNIEKFASIKELISGFKDVDSEAEDNSSWISGAVPFFKFLIPCQSLLNVLLIPLLLLSESLTKFYKMNSKTR